MKVAIVEIMPKGHITFLETLIKIFSSDKKNIIHVFTTPYLKKELNTGVPSVEYNISGNENENVFKKINEEIYDIIIICTLEKYYKYFLKVNFKSPVYLTIHNIDEWFNYSLRKRLLNFVYDLKLSFEIVYNFKIKFIYPHYRTQIIKEVIRSRGKFVVLNEYIKKELSTCIDRQNIMVIPFSVYDGLKDNSYENKNLRICIPGILSQGRRDYFSILKLWESDPGFFKNVTLDLLGSVSSKEQGEQIYELAANLKHKGFDIITYSDSFIPLDDFDLALSKCDLILGNLNIQQGKYSFYGRTKETGIFYTFIKAAKPGIMIEGYPVSNEVSSSVLIYKDMSELKRIIERIVNDKEYLISLKKEAQINSHKFEPHKIYSDLFKQ